MRRYLIAGVLTGSIVAAIYAAPALTQGRPAAPAVRIQAGDGGTLGLAHTIRVEGAAAPSLDGGVASIYVAAGAGGVLSVAGAAPVASSGGLTPTVSLTPCAAAGQLLKSDGGAWGCASDNNTTYSASASGGLHLDGTEFRLMTCSPGYVPRSVSAGVWGCATSVSSLTATAPITATSGGTPVIGCETASGTQAGCLSAADFQAFADDANTTYSAGNQLTLNGTQFNVTEGSGSGLDADKLDGLEPSAMVVGTAAALAANPTDCAAGQYATTIASNGNLGCATVQGSQVSGAVATASALAANPADCSAGQYATAIAASGNLTCATPPDSDTLAGLSCSESLPFPYWNEMNGEWTCVATPSGTVPTCSNGQILKSNGSSWVCASQFTASNCTSGQVAIGINSSGGVVCATLYIDCGGACTYHY